MQYFQFIRYKILLKKTKSKKIKHFNFFENFKNLEVIEGDLKDPKIMSLADIIIFQYGLSSTFIPLVCSKSKLIYVDCGWEKWNKNLMKVLNKRCDVVRANFDKKNRIRIKLDDLKKALIENNKSDSEIFFKKYLLK